MQNNPLKLLTYVSIIFIGPLLAYYLIYVQAREEALLDRTYSHLTNITTRTEARINSVFTVMKNACSSPYKFSTALKENDLGLNIIKSNWDPWEACDHIKSADSREKNTIQPISRERLEISFGEITASANTGLLVGAIDLSQRFHDIFIFNGEGKIVYQKYPENGRIEHFEELRSKTKDLADDKPLLRDPLDSLRVNYRGRWYLMPSQALQIDFINDADNNSNWLMVGLIEQSQFNTEKLQFQPDTVAWVVLFIAVIILIGPFLKIWYLGRFESLKKIDVVFLIGAGFTLCALLTLVVIHVSARAGLNGFMNDQLKYNAQHMAKDIRAEIKANLRELNLAEPAMRATYDQLSDDEVQRFSDCTLQSSKAKTDSDSCIFPNWAGNLLTNNNLSYRPTHYPFFNMAYLMDRQGCQVVKWATQRQPTNVGCFGDRAYFLRPLVNTKLPFNLFRIDITEDNTGEGDDSVSPQHQDFFVEFITSRTTGEKTVAISIPISDDKTTEGEASSPRQKCLNANSLRPTPCVAVMTSSAFRALQPVLPYGFGFALVDKNGALLTHHEGNANTELNLIDELSDGNLLRAVLYSDSEAVFESEYHSTLHKFYVQPLDISGASFFLVIFYSQDSVLIPLLESTGTTLMAWLIWFALLFCLALTVWQWNKFLEGRLFCIASRIVNRFNGLLLGGAAVLIAASLYKPVLSLIAPVYLVPVLTAWLFKASNNFRSRPFTVVSVSWILVLSATSLPAQGLFRMINAETFAGFFQLHVLEYQQNLAKQRTVIRRWLSERNIDMDDKKYAPFLANDFSERNEYASFWKQYPLFTVKHLNATGHIPNLDLHHYLPFAPTHNTANTLPGLILGELPDYSDNTIQLHAMYRNPKQLASFNNNLRIRDLSETLRQKLLRGYNNGAAYALGFIFLVILGVGLWYVLVRTLGLRTENYLRLNNFTIPATRSGRRQLLYGLSEFTKIDFFKDAEPNRLRKLDLRLLTGEEALEAVSPLLTPLSENTPQDSRNAQADILILDHFDDCLMDREVIMARIQLLEHLARQPSLSVVILLTVDPLCFVTATFDTEADAPLIARLSAALARYNVSHYQESPPDRLGDSAEDMILREECYHPNLRAIYVSIHERSSQKHLDSNEIIQLVKSRANAIYQQMWNLCTRAEKIMLVELANDNLVNPNNWDLARRLKQRGYLRRDPFHRIFNESFKQFILRMERVEKIDSWRKESTSTWYNIKAPLFVVVIGAIIFLAVTQPSFFNSVFAFAAAGTASLPFLVNLIMAKLKSGIEK